MDDAPLTCVACGYAVDDPSMYVSAVQTIMQSLVVCSRCAQWEVRARAGREKNSVRVNGVLYVIRPETPRTRTSEASSSYAHTIKFKNGRVVYTTHLARYGDIPERYRSRLPDNATFLVG